MTRYTVLQGQHAFTPPIAWKVGFRPDRIGVFGRLTDSCRYTLPGGDQDDWCKFDGESFNLLSNHVNSVMLAWRWDVDAQIFQLSPYYHVNRQTLHSQFPVLAVQPEELFVRWTWYEDFTATTFVQRESDMAVIAHVKRFPRRLPLTMKKIGAYFGGNRKAPHRMELYKCPVKEWTESERPDWSQIEA